MTDKSALHPVEEFFRLIADLSYHWEYWIGPEGEFRYVSPACERITGYRPDEFLADRRLLLNIVHPDDRPLARLHEESDSGGVARRIEYRIVARGGEERRIEHACQPVYAADGTWLGYRASNRDITEAKRVEMERDRHAARLQALFAYSQAVLAEDTVEGLLQCTVDAGRDLTGARIGIAGYDAGDGAFQLEAISCAGTCPAQPEGEEMCADQDISERVQVLQPGTVELADEAERALAALRDPGDDRVDRGVLRVRFAGRDGEPTGSLVVMDRKDRREFSAEDEAILSQLAAIASLALQHIEARTALEREAATLEKAHEELAATGEELRRQNEELRRSGQALHRSEERYRQLFEGMSEGFALHEVIRDASGKPVDYRFLEVNPAFERLTRLKKDELVGKRVRDVLPGTEEFWIDTYGLVAATGEPAHFEQYSSTLDRHYAVSAYRPAEEQFACLFLDVTDRVETERALRENEQKLLALFEILPVGVSILDSQRKIRYMNPALTRILDLPAKAASAGRHTQRVYRRPDGSEMPASEFPSARAVREQRVIRDVEIGVVKEDGALMWTNVSAAPLPFEDWRVILVTADITEQVAARKRIEELATEAQEQAAVLDTMLASIAESVVFYSPDGRITRANAAARRFLGDGVAEDGRPLAESVAQVRPAREDGTPLTMEELAVTRALHGETVTGLNIALHSRPGPPTWASVSAAPVYGPDSSLLGAIVGFTDITELRRARDELEERVQERTRELIERTIELQQANENLKRAEEQLRRQNQELVATQHRAEEEWHRYQELFHFAPDGYLVTTENGTIVEANRAAGELLGMPADRLPGKQLDRYVLPADGAAFGDALNRLRASTGGPARRWEMRLQRNEGEVVHAAVAATVSSRVSDEVEGVRWLLRDVTREKQMHAALVHAEKLSLAGQIAASFAHEIKNPLAAAISCVDLVHETLADGEDPNELLDVIGSSLERAARVVSQLQELHQRSESEDKKPADLNDLVEEVLVLAGKQARSAGVLISWQRAEGAPLLPVMVDGMKQVFLNLVLNAVEAMPGGGHLDVRILRADRPAQIGVEFADDGPGIAPEMRERLFEPFRTTKSHGSGLGLFVSQNIVQQHGGVIEVESAKGDRTRFTVWLPV